MELQVTQENLSRALNTVARVAGGRSTLPILSNILLQIKDNRLLLSATNLDIAISEYIGAKIVKPGSLTIPARLMQDFVASLPSGTINITQEDHKLHIVSNNYDSTINGVASDEFPVMPTIQNGQSWTIDAAELKKALQQVVFAASSDEARPVLTGVYMHSKAGKLYIAATDSYRLAEKVINFKSKAEIAVLVPASALQDLLRVLGDTDKPVEVVNDEQQILFRVDNVELVARLIEGNYPDYQKLIPAEFAVSAGVAKDEFVNIVKVSSLFARETAGSITANIDQKKNEISIRAIASQVGENTASASAKVSGEGEITLNSRYLLDGLQAVSGDEISFSFNGKLDPVVIKNPAQKDYTHIVMPLKS